MCIGSLGNIRCLILKTRVFWSFSLYITNAERSALCNSAIYFVLPLWKSGGTNKCNFQKHAVAPWRRQMWKEDGLTCSLDTQQGSARRCHVGAGCPPACRGEVQAPHSSFAWLLLILLLFCFITLMCALLMPFHSRARSFIQKLI